MAIDRKKFRAFDFTHEEFCKHFDMNQKTFANRFNRFIVFYKMNKKKN